MNPMHLAKLTSKLDAKRKTLASLQGRQAAESKRLEAFPMGPGCGTAAKRRVQGRQIDASVARATEIVRLSREVAQLAGEIEGYRAGRIDERGRRIMPVEDLHKLVETGEAALKTGVLKGRALDSEQLEALKETLRDCRRKLRRAETREADEARREAQRDRVREGLEAERASEEVFAAYGV